MSNREVTGQERKYQEHIEQQRVVSSETDFKVFWIAVIILAVKLIFFPEV